MHNKIVIFRIAGFIGSVLLTLAAFFILYHPEIFPSGSKTALIILLTLAVIQFAVQFICFLDIWREKKPRWNLVVFATTLSIVLIVVLFTIWIMGHLNYNMMITNHLSLF